MTSFEVRPRWCSGAKQANKQTKGAAQKLKETAKNIKNTTQTKFGI